MFFHGPRGQITSVLNKPMMLSARLRHVSATHWGTRKSMNMKLLEEMDEEVLYSAA